MSARLTNTQLNIPGEILIKIVTLGVCIEREGWRVLGTMHRVCKFWLEQLTAEQRLVWRAAAFTRCPRLADIEKVTKRPASDYRALLRSMLEAEEPKYHPCRTARPLPPPRVNKSRKV